MAKFKVGDVIYDVRPDRSKVRGKITQVEGYRVLWNDTLEEVDHGDKWLESTHIIDEGHVIDKVLEKYL
jgi:hypothetical protein